MSASEQKTWKAYCFKFPYIPASEIDSIFQSDDIWEFGFYGFIIPYPEKSDIYLFANVTDMSAIDRLEEKINLTDVAFEELNQVVKLIGIKYSTRGTINFASPY